MSGSIGFVVNPIAGVGGRAGHKGSDDPALREEALRNGAFPPARARAAEAASLLAKSALSSVHTWGGDMGESFLRDAEAIPVVVGHPGHPTTTPEDTIAAASALADSGIDLLVFVGGDGTARNILDALAESVPVIGVPAGVKMYSGVFAPHPRIAVAAAEKFISSRLKVTAPAEVLDIDEAALRAGSMKTELYGYLNVPAARASTQGMKSPSPSRAETDLMGIAASISESLPPGAAVILGPGSTVQAVGKALGASSTLLGVDVIRDGAMVVEDASESALLRFVADHDVDRLVVSPIGGQGFILGRGNQQISPDVVRQVGLDRLQVVATKGKLQALEGRPLLFDTGDDELDRELSGWVKVTVGSGERVVYPVEAASQVR